MEKFTKWLDEHPKTVFGIRVALWSLFSAVLPFAFIAWRYGIFTKKCVIQITGWGIVAIIIVVIFIITLVRYLYKGLQPGLFKQCISGFISMILPLTLLYLLICGIETNVTLFKQALGCVIICEIAGIPLNPFPDWLEKQKKEQSDKKIDSLTDALWDKFFTKKKENDKK